MVAESIDLPGARLRVSMCLEEARQRRGIRSWAEVARRSGLRPTTLSQLVNGKIHLSDVRMGTLVRLCAALDTSLDELVRIESAEPHLHPRADRPLRDDEFAALVARAVSAPLPDDWQGPTDVDLDDATATSTADLAARFRGQGSLQRFGLG
ncbi:MAG: helix-turn-helix transcriptional regulator [Chloroflexi bacterium]|nr:helix-turn-helix transcriptional regulator [Chloroflexota bacterium]